MKVCIRRGVFETNSSSMHSISLGNLNEEYTSDSLVVDENNNVVAEGGEFGWEIETFRYAGIKLSYLVTYLFGSYEPIDEKFVEEHTNFIDPDVLTDKKREMFDKLERVIKEETGGNLCVKCMTNNYYQCGYIDHQSIDVPEEILKGSEDTIKNFIFNKKSILVTDNDNH